MKHVVMLSGGVPSYITAKRVVFFYGKEDTTLLFADTKMEDEDLYRFLHDITASLDMPITSVSDGRTPWEVFFDEGMIGNTRADLCSRILKRDLLRAWLFENFDPKDTTVYLGYDANEQHRVEAARGFWDPWNVEFPLVESGVFSEQLFVELAQENIRRPRLYDFGFPHNNCGGFCIKAGQGAFISLLRSMPARFEYHAAQERRFRDETGKDVAILRDRRGGKTRPFTLDQLRRRHESEPELLDLLDIGGCGCMNPLE